MKILPQFFLFIVTDCFYFALDCADFPLFAVVVFGSINKNN